MSVLEVVAIVAGASAPVIALFSYFLVKLVRDNESSHSALWDAVDAIREDVTELKSGQAAIEAKIDMIIGYEKRRNGDSKPAAKKKPSDTPAKRKTAKKPARTPAKKTAAKKKAS